MKNLKIAVILLITGILLLSGCTQQTQAPPTGNDLGGENTDGALVVGTFKVTRTDAGYSPSPLTIKKGSTVVFENQSNQMDWPASAMHPTHTKYPGSGIEKCGTSEAATIFDACKELGKGDTYSFTFNEVGEWAYHDHVAATKFGKIIVVE